MNKFAGLILSAVLMMGLPNPCFADQVQGLVESVDSSNNSIVIKDPVSGAAKAVRVHPKVIADVKKGSVAKATLKAGSDEADTLQVLMVR